MMQEVMYRKVDKCHHRGLTLLPPSPQAASPTRSGLSLLCLFRRNDQGHAHSNFPPSLHKRQHPVDTLALCSPLTMHPRNQSPTLHRALPRSFISAQLSLCDLTTVYSNVLLYVCI